MKKMMGILFLVLMIVLSLGSWKKIRAANGREERTYQSYMDMAEKFEGKKIYIDAIAQYENAYEMSEDPELLYKISDLYLELGEEDHYYTTLQRINSKCPDDFTNTELLIQNEIEKKEYDIAYQYAVQALSLESCDDEWQEKMNEYIHQLHTVADAVKYLKYDASRPYVFPTDGSAATSVVQLDGNYTAVSENATPLLEGIYDDLGFYGDGYYPACIDGEYCYIDTNEYRRRVPDFSVTWLGSFSEKYAAFCHGEKDENGESSEKKGLYGYLDVDMHSYAVQYKFAGTFYNGYAAVEDTDGKWYLIDHDFQKINDTGFDEILMDENGISTYGSVFWGKQNGEYALYGVDGSRRGEDTFSEVKLFKTEEPCAVKFSNGLWGFYTVDGKAEVQGTYTDALSYAAGIAGVKAEGEEFWTVIESDQRVIFDDSLEQIYEILPDRSFLAKSQEVNMHVYMHKYE